jgi:hypothetical protein
MKTTVYFGALVLFLSSCVGYYDNEPSSYEVRERFLGSYDVEEHSDTYHETTYYTMFIVRSYHSNEVILDGLYAANLQVYATVSNNYISIPFQVVDGFEIEGSGSYSRGRLDLHFTVYDSYADHARDYCETVAYKL